jgi:putative glutathione S-transferase
MGLLIDGEWRGAPPAQGDAGDFVRQASTFRHQITADGSSGFKAEPGRYHLYVSRACPWCHRAMIYRVLKRLENIISIGFVEPTMREQGWTFAQPDPLTGARHIYEVYQQADPLFTGRATVPVLWDKESHGIVNNESSDIIRMLNTEFDEITHELTNFYPDALANEIDEVNSRVYDSINNGVYRAGFASTQTAYETAAKRVFEGLDWAEERLRRQRYLLGDLITEADWRLFPTLVRFDAVYYGHFKCNVRRIRDYPALWAYTRELYQIPGIAGTVSIDEYKAHYYGSHLNINPTGIIPIGPELDFTVPHGRAEAFPRRDGSNTASVTALSVSAQQTLEEESTVEVPAFKQTGSSVE